MTSSLQKASELLKQLSDQYERTKDPAIGEKIILLVEGEFIDVYHNLPKEEERNAYSSFGFIGNYMMKKSRFRIYRELKKEEEELEVQKENERLVGLYSLDAKSPSQIKVEKEIIEKRVYETVVGEIGFVARSVALADEMLGRVMLSKPIMDACAQEELSSVSHFLEDIAHKVLWIAQCSSEGKLTENTIDPVGNYVQYLSNQFVSSNLTNKLRRLSSQPINKHPELCALLYETDQRNARFKLIDEILTERIHQITKHGYSEAHDDEHTDGSIADAAAHYASTRDDTGLWPWDAQYDRKSTKTRREQCMTSMSMMMAEVERIDRADARCVTTADLEK